MRAESGTDERRLVREAQDGSGAAMAQLYSLHWRGAYRAAYLVVHDAAAVEHIAQDGFLAAVDAPVRFDGRRPFAPWLHRIVANRAIDWARARTARRETPADDARPNGRDDPDAPSRDLLRALAALPPDQRAVVVLRHLLGYTPGQVARML